MTKKDIKIKQVCRKLDKEKKMNKFKVLMSSRKPFYIYADSLNWSDDFVIRFWDKEKDETVALLSKKAFEGIILEDE